MSQPRNVTRLSRNLPWVLVLLLAGSNGLLVYENLGLRAEASQAYRTRSVRVGDRVAAFSGWASRGDVDVTYEDPGRATILLYLSPSCSFCTAQLPGWRTLVDSVDPAQYDIYAILAAGEAPEIARSYLDEGGLGKVKIVFVNREVLAQYGFQYTPTTMVVGGDRMIQKIWTGLWNQTTREEVAQYFSIDPDSP